MIKIDFKILSKKWQLRVLRGRKYNKKKERTGSLGITFGWKRRIDIHKKALTFDRISAIENIVHELTHAYLAESGVDSTTELSVFDLEEIFAEMLAKRGRELLDLADKIYDYALKEIKKEEGSV